ncbi:MAG: proprotein convertase P-domain-containing protein [Deltaproteobacteria bacterium]|nr:proprotein convertase P-domain-containing protein [Deltaproteobacteria bacterium]
MRHGMKLKTLFFGLALSAGAFGCDDGAAPGGTDFDENASNPLTEPAETPGKADTQYFNPDGIEVEVDIEADLDAPDSRKSDGPAILGQFAMTYLRNNKSVYIESLAEQASSADRVEWLIDGAWKSGREIASVAKSKLTHFRIRGINAVLLNSAKNGVTVGTVFDAPVPVKPFSIYADGGTTCGDAGGHIELSQTYYWYLWNPRAGCTAKTQTMKVTVSKMLPSKVTYPEYDKLVADGKVTMVVLFGLIDDELSKTETGYRAFLQMGKWLAQGGFKEVKPAPVGVRYTKTVKGVEVQVDLYSPYDFSGLSDSAHFGNFQKALSEHEIVTYDGHSMLGASDFWNRPTYPNFYQVFLYGGCLGYEYYVAPILAGKGGWDKLDLLSAVVEVSANANEFAGPFLAKLLLALDNGYKVSWKDILGAIRTRVGDSTFGMSGVRDNCFSPTGSLCTTTPTPTPGAKTYSNTTAATIPDNKAAGVTSSIDATDTGTIDTLSVKVSIDHSWIGDLVVTLVKDGVSAKLYDGAGVAGTGLDQTFTVTAFKGKALKGKWSLVVVDTAADDVGTLKSWTLNATLK